MIQVFAESREDARNNPVFVRVGRGNEMKKKEKNSSFPVRNRVVDV